MKLQCACGVKYAFEVQPKMLSNPVQFVCPSCGLDSSAFVNQLVQQELGVAPPPADKQGVSGAGCEVSGNLTPDAPRLTQPAPARVRLHRGGPNPADLPPPATDQQVCSKHPGQLIVEHCVVCHKPLCPKCMELFGYVCSPLCKQKAGLQGIEVPEFAGQKAVVERRHWRKVGLVVGSVSAAAVAFLGVWIWYEFFGSRPSSAFSVRFPEPSYSGQSSLCGKNQIVFLHGDTLARHDLKTKKEIWSCQLVDKKQIEQELAATIKAMQLAKEKAESENPDSDGFFKTPSPEKLGKQMARAAAEALELHVRGQNVWVSTPEKLVRYDWDTGKPLQEIPLPGGLGGAIHRGDELLLLAQNDAGQEVITHINLATGKTRAEEIGEPTEATLANAPAQPTKSGAGKSARAGATAGLTRPSGSPKPLDPAKVASQVQSLPLPGRIALPAVLSVNANQEKVLAEIREQERGKPPPAPGLEAEADHFSLIPTQDGFVQFSVNLLESKIVARSALKARPKKSALDGPVSVTATADVANEIFNEMQRDRGGDIVEEDESRYQVTVRLPGAKNVPDWTGEVLGPPALYPLKTVNVVAAGKTLTVLDKSNKKKWQAALTHRVSESGGALDEEHAPYGLGPCVERGNTLYVIDQGVLTAFDLDKGEARWRLPSVGIAGLFFDDEGKIYVNSTTASPDTIKYSRQIDVTEKTSAVILKLDPQKGTTLWSAEPGGQISHLSGKFIYTISSYQPDDDEDNPYTPDTGFEKLPYMKIKRINPKNGRVMWEHFQQRCPLDAQFEKNSIQLVFKKEVQVLKFLSF